MPRPRKEGKVHVYRLTLRLWEGEHDDLIAYLDAAPPRGLPAAVIRGLYSGRISADVSDADDGIEDDVLDLADDLLM